MFHPEPTTLRVSNVTPFQATVEWRVPPRTDLASEVRVAIAANVEEEAQSGLRTPVYFDSTSVGLQKLVSCGLMPDRRFTARVYVIGPDLQAVPVGQAEFVTPSYPGVLLDL